MCNIAAKMWFLKVGVGLKEMAYLYWNVHNYWRHYEWKGQIWKK